MIFWVKEQQLAYRHCLSLCHPSFLLGCCFFELFVFSLTQKDNEEVRKIKVTKSIPWLEYPMCCVSQESAYDGWGTGRPGPCHTPWVSTQHHITIQFPWYLANKKAHCKWRHSGETKSYNILLCLDQCGIPNAYYSSCYITQLMNNVPLLCLRTMIQ